MKSLSIIQKQVDEWIKQYPEGYWDSHAIVTHAMKELGEVAREIHHIHGPKWRKKTEGDGDLGGEIADVLFSLICLANKHGIDLDAAWTQKIEKIYTRDKDRFAKKWIFPVYSLIRAN